MPGLASFAADLGAAWRRLQASPLFSWLTPSVPVRLDRPDGSHAFWLASADGLTPLPAGQAPASAFRATEIPEEHLLVRRIMLPALSESEIRQAVALDVAAASPFAAEDLVWAYSTRRAANGMVEAQVVLASRRQVGALVGQGAGAGAATPEAWAWQPPFAPAVLPGFGEARRDAAARRGRRLAFGLVVGALVLAVAAALTPVLQLRMRAVEANRAMEALVKRTEPALKQRAALTEALDAGNALGEMLAQRSQPLLVLDLLTQALPDDTSLLGLTVQGNKITINGMTGNAAGLMQLLSAHSQFRDVKAPTAATRPLGSPKDLFTIELVLATPATAAGGVTPAASASAPAGAATASVAPAPAASAPVTGAPAAAAVAAPPPPGPAAAAAAPPAPAPARSGGASFGGASFGAPARPAP
jgi:general secretion pathway protein L